jgi:hypothetical protein
VLAVRSHDRRCVGALRDEAVGAESNVAGKQVNSKSKFRGERSDD